MGSKRTTEGEGNPPLPLEKDFYYLAKTVEKMDKRFERYDENIRSLEKELASLGLNTEVVHRKFSYPEELFTILLIAEQYFEKIPNPPVNPFALILAIRESERGERGSS